MFKQFEELLERLVVAQERQAAALESLSGPVGYPSREAACEDMAESAAPVAAKAVADKVAADIEDDEADDEAEAEAAAARSAAATKAAATRRANAAKKKAREEAAAAAEAEAEEEEADEEQSDSVVLDDAWYDANLKAPTVALVNSSPDGRVKAGAVFGAFGVKSAKELKKTQWVEVSEALQAALEDDLA